MQDLIQRDIEVKAPQEVVYQIIADPKLLITWFPNSINGPFEVGQQSTFDFGEDGTAQVHVVAAHPFKYFAFRWYTGKDMVESVLGAPNTLVEFLIQATGDTTKVTVKESGFASLPTDIAEQNYTGNSSGWTYMMGRLEEQLNKK